MHPVCILYWKVNISPNVVKLTYNPTTNIRKAQWTEYCIALKINFPSMHLDTFQIYTSSNLNFPKDGPFHVLFSIKIFLYIYKVTSKVTIVLLLMVLKTYIFISKIAHNIDISPGVANKLPLEESDVDDR